MIKFTDRHSARIAVCAGIIALTSVEQTMAQDTFFDFDELDRTADSCRAVLLEQDVDLLTAQTELQVAIHSRDETGRYIMFGEKNDEYYVFTEEEITPSGQASINYCSIVGSTLVSTVRSITLSSLTSAETQMQSEELYAWFEAYLNRRAIQGVFVEIDLPKIRVDQRVEGKAGIYCIDENKMIIISAVRSIHEYIEEIRYELISLSELDPDEILDLDRTIGICNTYGRLN